MPSPAYVPASKKTPTNQHAMIHGHLRSPDAIATLLSHPVWREAFDFLENLPENLTKGISPIRGDEMYVNVMEYDTLPRTMCHFETHRKYVDLQYTIRPTWLSKVLMMKSRISSSII